MLHDASGFCTVTSSGSLPTTVTPSRTPPPPASPPSSGLIMIRVASRRGVAAGVVRVTVTVGLAATAAGADRIVTIAMIIAKSDDPLRHPGHCVTALG
eukprot:811695-Rhodomonas_salina.3